ncbi:LAGLIDADG family homing endonuclease [Nonomuraea angiospora]|uniref:LAGLIDADG family homing endonuclease n=1 Tax=Nonomuraea angiospora TaxID=46172 RepID=UPI00345054B4
MSESQIRHVVMMSGGIGSWATARHVIAQHGADATVLLFADTRVEHPTLYEFLDKAAASLGASLIRVADGRTPWQVFQDVRMIGNSRIAPCSKYLKQIPCRSWLETHTDPATTTVYVGIDWTEIHRLPAIEAAYRPWTALAPLCEPPYLSKDELMAQAKAAGLPTPRLYELGFPHNNCLHPDTQYITSEGIKTLRETCGQTVQVLGRGGGWREATIQAFGEQPTYELRLKRYDDTMTVITTADHLWPVRKQAGRSDYRFRTTLALNSGDRIAGMYGHVRHNVTPSTIGIMAGFTFGDGTAPTFNGQNQPARAYLCGDKDKALLPYFAACRTKEDNGIIRVLDLPRSWKQPPPLDESQSYLYGWLAGYFAADGSISKSNAKISSANLAHLETVKDVAAKVGIATGRVRTHMRTGYGKEPSPLYSMALVLATLREDFFLLPHHREAFLARTDAPSRPADWQVVEVVPTGRVEQVMCAVVPDGHIFTLDGNLLTHNCGGACVRGGQAQWARLLEADPERFAAEEAEEQQLRTYLGKDVAILRDRKGGTTKPLPLTELRRRVSGGQVDADDWGGCGCFTDTEAAVPPQAASAGSTLTCTIPASRQSAEPDGSAEPAAQEGLFTQQVVTPAEGPSLPYTAADPAVASAELLGDGYEWLAAFLPPPQAVTCPRCARPMRLATVPLLWQCRPCDGPASGVAPTRPESGLAA